MNFNTRLVQAQRKSRSLLCIGLDTDLKKIPKHLLKKKNPLVEFNRAIVEATHNCVCAYKLNLAFYEAGGEAGWRALRQTLAMIPTSVITIGDAKRGDIGNSSERYARSLFHDLKFDAVTVSPYMGKDSVAPFLESKVRGVFLLALTSNPGAQDFQIQKIGKQFLYEKVIETASQWSEGNIGFVVGATQAQQLRSIRKLAPHAPLLIPGIGAQGGDMESVVRFGCDTNGELAVINASRSILYASRGKDFAEKARSEAAWLNDTINAFRERFFP
ncbi:MAG: orotidine-5'-phosphate decarboxylase [Bacteroidota bacterium]|nr:orotidine-5'-phosphate decarboxylase [Bacteroidota bacterium]